MMLANEESEGGAGKRMRIDIAGLTVYQDARELLESFHIDCMNRVSIGLPEGTQTREGKDWNGAPYTAYLLPGASEELHIRNSRFATSVHLPREGVTAKLFS